jgi:hypothetical protein
VDFRRDAPKVNMSNNSTFTILSNGASLVEVQGDGPYSDLPGGLAVPDGVPTIGPVDLLNGFIRKWRVDAPASVQATVAITDSPVGALVGLRRCIAPLRPLPWWWFLAIDRWPRLCAVLQRRAPTIAALWYLCTDWTGPCDWKDVGDNNGMQVTAQGGDVVVVTFVSP